MAKAWNVAVLGATGLVGENLLAVLQERDFPVREIFPLASGRSLGKTVTFRGREVDWELWIEDGPRPLPRRYVILSRLESGAPEFAVRFSNWQPDAVVTDALFDWTPPSGATRVDLIRRPAEATSR